MKETYTPGGSIVIPEYKRDDETAHQTKAVIDQIGPNALTDPDRGLPNSNLKVGDTVIFQRYGAERIKSTDEDVEEYWVINAKDLLVQELTEVTSDATTV